MAEGGSLINFGELSKPATILVEKICNAVGIVYEPTRIKRQAGAEAHAEKIRALAKIEIGALEQRALERFVHQETRKQENIEQITAQAAAALRDDSNVEALEDDWIAHFFKQCDIVSDKEMQTLWARMLAGEATTPGTYSKRTIDFVSSFDKKDAALFTALCQFVWVIGTTNPLIYDIEGDVYKSQGINFTSLKHLDAIGLISLDATGGYQQLRIPKHFRAYYYGRPTLLEAVGDADNQLKIGHALFTAVGRELVPICGSCRNESFYQYVIQRWSQQGIVLSTDLASEATV